MATLAHKLALPVTSIKLPAARLDGGVSIEKVLSTRRSIREFTKQPLELSQVAQLAWAAQGVTGPDAHRTAPSAGGLYALELYVIAANVNGLPTGVYKYDLLTHEVVSSLTANIPRELSQAALDQSSIAQAAAIFVISAGYDRISSKYGDRGLRYAHMEAGHAAQNLLLQAVALDLGAVLVGAFNDGKVKRLLNLSKPETPLYLIPVGRPGVAT